MVENNRTQSKEEITKLSEKEHDFLRDELAHLKDCQVKFLTFSVTATAIILGMIGRSNLIFPTGLKPLSGEMWLIPLAVLLPAWWIFFDKATTITRIVGYFRLLEKIMLGKVEISNFAGWENALEEFRKKRTTKEKMKIWGKIWKLLVNMWKLFKILIFRTTHRYWVITYYIFFFLSLTCLIGGLKGTSPAIFIFLGGIFLISTIWNARILWSLIEGEYSYNKNQEKWETILQMVDKT